ncbi:cytochrome c biogenesis CcdA family protein [Spirillospora sp. NPDC052269]
MSGVGYAAAFLGGLLTLLSPCSALLLPAFFAYSFTDRTRLVGRTAVFYVGLCLTLVPLGAAGAAAGRLLYGHRDLLIGIGGWTVIALGAAQILGLGFGFSLLGRLAGRRGDAGSVLSVGLLGTVYGLSGFCSGPLLGGILTISAVGGAPVRGATMLAVYALGMAAPLFVLSLFWDRLDLGRRRWLRGRPITVWRLRTHSTSLIGGLLFVAIGVSFLYYDGGVVLPGLVGEDTEAAAEERALRIGDALPDAWILGALAVVLAGVAVVLMWRGVRGARLAAQEDEQSAGPRDDEQADVQGQGT